jgi:hypothetical protein
MLEVSHVYLEKAERHGLLNAVLQPASRARKILGKGFYRLLVLDATDGCARITFDLDEFLKKVRDEVVRVFDLQLESSAFHIADIFQMLKDEPCALFCFANFQVIPVTSLGPIREFTQGVHRVLFLTHGTRDLRKEERQQDSQDSGISDAVATPPPEKEVERFLLERFVKRFLKPSVTANCLKTAKYMMEGYTTEEIAAKLGVVTRTVQRYLRLIRSAMLERSDF